jgi:hypothetical protein
VSCAADSWGKSFKLFQHRVSRVSPEYGLAVLVVVGHEVIDLGHQLVDATEGAAPDGFLGDQCEETLYLIEP